jgi:hypothetical protein
MLCRTALSRGRVSSTEVTGVSTVTRIGSGRPTGFIVRPVVSGVSKGGAERFVSSACVASGGRPGARNPSAARFAENALVPLKIAAPAVTISSDDAAATAAARLSASPPYTLKSGTIAAVVAKGNALE